MKYSVSLSPQAVGEVDSIYAWIAKRSSLGAVNWYAAFTDAAEELRQNADRCALALESKAVGVPIREKLFKTRRGRKYRLVFVMVDDEIRILRVRGPGQRRLGRKDIDPNGS